MNAKLLLLLGTTVAIMTTGCVQKVRMKVLEPAEVGAMADNKKIAVTTFKKDHYVGLASKIETQLTKQIIDGKPYFTTVDRKSISNVIKEQKLQSSGLMDENTAVQIGKLVGAQALISGEITSTSSSDTNYQETRTKYRNPLKPLETAYTVNVWCKKRVIGMGASIKIVDIRRGSLVYADSLVKNKTYKSCRDSSRALPSKQQGIETISGEMAAEFAKKLAPQYVYIDVELIEKIEFDTTDRNVKAMEVALNWIKNNRFDKAQPILAKLNDSLQGKSYAVIYNLGVVAEATGKLEEAQKLYKEADKLPLEPNKAINASLTRIAETIEKRKKALAQIAK
jgi:hypothetical protein